MGRKRKTRGDSRQTDKKRVRQADRSETWTERQF